MDTIPRVHFLKTYPDVYSETWHGRKTFEFRKNDRGFKEGDFLCLREFTASNGYSGRFVLRKVTYILQGGTFGIPAGYCIMSVDHVEYYETEQLCGELMLKQIENLKD